MYVCIYAYIYVHIYVMVAYLIYFFSIHRLQALPNIGSVTVNRVGPTAQVRVIYIYIYVCI
jgi:hypothetical protein